VDSKDRASWTNQGGSSWDVPVRLRVLAETFGVPVERLRRFHARGEFELELRTKGGFPAWYGRPSALLDLPILSSGDVARRAGVSLKTISRDRRAGGLPMVRRRRSSWWWCTPREAVAYVRRRRAAKSGRLPSLERLVDMLPPPE
jgi:hypothetical protein